MPMGADYTCNNKRCHVEKKRISLHGPWPIANIQAVIDSDDYKGDIEGQTALRKRKASGRVFALASLPNKGKLKVQGMRVQLYCPKCKVVWDEDTPYNTIGVTSSSVMDAVVGGKIISPDSCPACGSQRMSCDAKSLPCPGCGQLMARKDWFTKFND